MSEAKETKRKDERHFGGGPIERVSPPREKLSTETPKLNVELSLEAALMLNLAIDECIRRVNGYNRSTAQGKRAGVGVTVHLELNRVSVYEAKLPAGDPRTRGKAPGRRASS